MPAHAGQRRGGAEAPQGQSKGDPEVRAGGAGLHGRAVQADLWLTPRVDRHWRQRLKLKCDEPLSDFAFNLNLRTAFRLGFRFQLAPLQHGAAVGVLPVRAYRGGVVQLETM